MKITKIETIPIRLPTAGYISGRLTTPIGVYVIINCTPMMGGLVGLG